MLSFLGRHWRTGLGLLLTAAWCITFVAWTGVDATTIMKPNEWGDWAAGLAAPIAFLWLVLGYFQQGEELRENVRALRLQEKALQLQVKELQASVEQQTKAAKSSERQAELLEKSREIALRAQVLQHQPRFVQFRLRGVDEAAKSVTLSFLNMGQPCYTVVFATRIGGVTRVAKGNFAETWGGVTERNATFVFENELQTRFTVIISYQDELLVEQEQSFEVNYNKEWALDGVVDARVPTMSTNLPKAADFLPVAKG